ncbi:hypothetical protein [Vibrio anguillarum]|uniref:hypothetical protein n=1 Tax=Vibrio anguillarum TaxID=55601 RepID=UPI00188D7C91|nr:hypothetical protein [Vibrio anguillarum]MBF4258977.1 hypothetical protein [Vibrio anguillarum]
MSKSDHKFVNTSEKHELEDWLYRNGISKSKENVDKLKVIIDEKVKQGETKDNISWDELDSAYKNNPKWFDNLTLIGK